MEENYSELERVRLEKIKKLQETGNRSIPDPCGTERDRARSNRRV